jgi:formylglycine-generating enzyme required for sulfatase activity
VILDDLRERLATAEGWEARAAVFARAGEGAEPAATLDLLDGLRRQTRNGNDLFFLRAALDRVGRARPTLARAAQRLRECFYDHIPRPAEELFRWLETPRGRADAWCAAPPGRCLIGSLDGEGQEDERPRWEARFDQGFRIGAGPVTNAQYAAFDPDRPRKAWDGVADAELAEHPAGGITWYEANAFCDWLSQAFALTRGARLPGEEEWEYACRAGSETLYWNGNAAAGLARVGWYRANSGERTHRIGEKPANAWGLFDVHGNVREWTASPYQQDYARRATHALPPARVASGEETTPGLKLILRGGGFLDEAPFLRSAIRCVRHPEIRYWNVGFRVLLPA